MRTYTLLMAAAAGLLFAALSLQSARADGGEEGSTLYSHNCASCHGANGKGAIPGLPDFTLKTGVLSQTDSVLIDRITNGYQAPGAPMPMPPKGGNASLSHDDIVAILGYMRQAFAAGGK